MQQETGRDLVHEPVQDFAVVGHSTHQRANLVSVVVRDGQLLQSLHQPAAEFGGQGGPDPRGQPTFPGTDQRQHHAGHGQCQHHQEQSLQKTGQRHAGQWLLQDVVDQVLLEFGWHQFGQHADNRQRAERERASTLGPNQLPDPTEDGSAGQASRTGLPGRRQTQLAFRTSSRIHLLRGMDLEFARGPQLLQLARHFVEAVVQRVRVAGQVDPHTGSLGLQRPRTNAGASAELVHFLQRQRQNHIVPAAVADQ